MMPTRSDVYTAIDGERDYQDRRWNTDTTSSEGKHSIGEFLLFIEDYVAQARTQLTRQGEPKATEDALNTMRKIAALAVVCMEQNGVIPRASEAPSAYNDPDHPGLFIFEGR